LTGHFLEPGSKKSCSRG